MFAGHALAPAHQSIGSISASSTRRSVVWPKLVTNGSTSGIRISRSTIASILIDSFLCPSLVPCVRHVSG